VFVLCVNSLVFAAGGFLFEFLDWESNQKKRRGCLQIRGLLIEATIRLVTYNYHINQPWFSRSYTHKKPIIIDSYLL